MYWLILLLAILLTACSSNDELRPFKSDGCSLFPDRSALSNDDWCSCCFDHDVAYWKGGSKEAREAADSRLRECIYDKTGNDKLATLMYEGVRLGGSPYFYNWYRWGYGWGFDRKYKELTSRESDNAARLLKDYFDKEPVPVCRK